MDSDTDKCQTLTNYKLSRWTQTHLRQRQTANTEYGQRQNLKTEKENS